MYDALHKRPLYLDAIGKGLDIFGIKKMISVFPEICKPAFVSDGKLLPFKAEAYEPTGSRSQWC